MARFVVCIPVDGVPSVAPCGDVGGVAHAPAVTEFPVPGDVHWQNSETLFAFGFSAVVLFWAIGHGIGAVLSMLRQDH